MPSTTDKLKSYKRRIRDSPFYEMLRYEIVGESIEAFDRLTSKYLREHLPMSTYLRIASLRDHMNCFGEREASRSYAYTWVAAGFADLVSAHARLGTEQYKVSKQITTFVRDVIDADQQKGVKKPLLVNEWRRNVINEMGKVWLAGRELNAFADLLDLASKKEHEAEYNTKIIKTHEEARAIALSYFAESAAAYFSAGVTTEAARVIAAAEQFADEQHIEVPKELAEVKEKLLELKRAS